MFSRYERLGVRLPWHRHAETLVKTHRLVMLVGEPGMGKTTFARAAAEKHSGQPPEVLQGTPETEMIHVWGLYALAGGETKFVDGPLPRALKRGRVMLVEEFNLIPVEVRASLLALRSSDQTVNPFTGEELAVLEAFRLIATSNTETLECRSNGRVAQALLDDFLILEVPALRDEQVGEMLASNFPSATKLMIGKVMTQFQLYREIETRDGAGPATMRLSYRAADHLMRLLLAGMDEATAVRVALQNKYITDKDLHVAAKLKGDLSEV